MVTVARRVMILGGSASGKSWLAQHLGARGSLPVHHMDALSWKPGFVHRTRSELDRITREIHAQPCWVLEGGHYETGHERAARADALIWLDLKLGTQMWRAAWRTWRYSGQVRPGQGEGCVQWFRRDVRRVVGYVASSQRFHRERAEEIAAAAPPHLAVIRLTSGRQARRFLAACQAAPDGPGLLLPD